LQTLIKVAAEVALASIRKVRSEQRRFCNISLGRLNGERADASGVDMCGQA